MKTIGDKDLSDLRANASAGHERLGRSLDVSIAGSDLMLALRVASRIRRLAIMDELKRMGGAA